jgi:Ca-activated chloride channel family protein
MPSLGLVRAEALPLLAVVAIIAALALWADVRRRRALAAFAGRGAELASVSEARRRAKAVLVLVALTLAIVALAGPYVDVVERNVVQSGVDIVIALDVSQSMAVRDVDPDRLRAAKQFIHRLADGLTQSRVALVLFAGEGIVRYPATADPSVLGETLDHVTLDFRPKGGSSLRSGVDAALKAFSAEARESSRRKAVILVTDGEDTTAQSPDVEALRQRNIRIFTIGVGTASGGFIPTYDRSSKFLGYLKRANGEQIVSRLDEPPLRALAERSDGRYWRLAGFQTVNEVATELKRLDASQLGEVEGGSVPDDRYQLFLALAIVALIAEELLTERRGMPRPRWLRAPRPRARRRIPLPTFAARLLPVLVIAALVATGCEQVSAPEADRLYLSGDHPAALDRYRVLLKEHPGVPELHVNTGNALHQLGEHPAAIAEYAIGIRDGAQAIRAVALYQRGNTLFRTGKLEEAREAYKDALRADPRDRDAKFNIEVIDRMLGISQELPSGGPPQPGESGQPQPGQGQQDPSNAPGQSPGPGEQQPGPPGSQGPQASGPPATSGDQTGPSLAEALRDFRSKLTAEEALRLLDALMSDARGIELLIEGQPQQPPGQPGQPRPDPSY